MFDSPARTAKNLGYAFRGPDMLFVLVTLRICCIIRALSRAEEARSLTSRHAVANHVILALPSRRAARGAVSPWMGANLSNESIVEHRAALQLHRLRRSVDYRGGLHK